MKLFLFSKDIETLESIKKFIDDNLGKDLSINFIASTFGIGKSTLRRHFSGYYKQTIHSYLLKVRMEEAKRLLLEHSFSVTEISIRVGFKERTAFTHAFVKHAGCTPLNFRTQTLTNQSTLTTK